MPTCYLGLGSNLRNPKRQLQLALNAIQKSPHILIKNTSNLYFNPPMGIKSQPMFYNLVIEINTNIYPELLLKKMKSIEMQQNRITKQRWGARSIDIDILLYGQQRINLPNLQIPHPGILDREFVKCPLAEISPNINLENLLQSIHNQKGCNNV